MIVKRSKVGKLADINNRDMFQFTQRNDRTTYVMIDNHQGTYRKRSGKEVLQVADREERWTTQVVEVFEMPELTERGNEAFVALVAKANEIGWPEHFYDDLWIHDRRMIAIHDPAVFGWSVRSTGSHIIIANQVYSLFLTAHEPQKHPDDQKSSRKFFWNGSSLKEMPMEMIEERVIRAGCQKFKDFSHCSWNVKNNTTLSAEWQKEIDAEIAGKATLRSELIGKAYC